MNYFFKKRLNIKFLMIITVLVGSTQSAYANLPVIDVTNLTQNIMTAMESTAAVAKQIDQYHKQVEQWTIQGNQYKNMVTNSQNPSSWTWDPASSTITSLLTATDTLDHYKSQDGSVQNYLSHYQDIQNQNPCFTSDNCTDQQRQTLVASSQNAGSEAEKRANDAMLLGVDQQQQTLKSDSKNLNNLQSQATGATGRMQAIQAGNQIASAQANQLLQIRALLVAQQNAEATRAEVISDREAQQTAADQNLVKGSFQPSPVVNW